jgi:hypothetical protein
MIGLFAIINVICCALAIRFDRYDLAAVNFCGFLAMLTLEIKKDKK